MLTAEKLQKIVESPGLATFEEIQEVMSFLFQLKDMRDIYRSAYPSMEGRSLESYIDSMGWYLNYHSENSKN